LTLASLFPLPSRYPPHCFIILTDGYPYANELPAVLSGNRQLDRSFNVQNQGVGITQVIWQLKLLELRLHLLGKYIYP